MAGIKHLCVDIESYSDVDIKKAGVYKYTESPAFDILLIAWAVDNGPVRLVDLTIDPGAEGSSREYQNLMDFFHDFYDPDTVRHSYNAAFENQCLNTWLRRQGRATLQPGDWKCTMAHGQYCGYTAGLAATGEAMGLPADKKKLGIGAALIRKFCVPQKPNKTHPEPWRVRPADEPEKWELFKQYCRQDVETEREIERRLSKWPMPAREQLLWELTTEANLEGVAVDMDLVAGALDVGEREQAELIAEARALSGLDNPKSTQQLLKWLNTELDDEVADLRKTTVAELLKAGVDSEKATRMLELRQLISKTSTKKYDAIQAAACADGRVRGMLAYYGANRTGRWAGRIVQPQNLPQNHLDGLDDARALVKARDLDMLRLCWGSVPDTLSQLIRTALVPSRGRRYAVADYSAIEARVVAWLAGETWVLDAFRAGKDIYCATASQMFGVPVEKHGVNGELRQKGKIATLACIAEGSPVLTDRGLVRIEDVLPTDRLWDGESWVSHDGVICKGERRVITYDGITATPDHLVFVEGEPEPVQLGDAASRGLRLVRTGAGGQALQLGQDHQPRAKMEPGPKSQPGADRMSGLRRCTVDAAGEPAQRQVEGLSALFAAEADPEMAGPSVDGGKAALREPERPGVPALRREGHPVRVCERDRGRCVPDPDLRPAGQADGDRPDRQQRALRPGKHTLCDPDAERRESGNHGAEPIRAAVLAIRGNDDPAKAGGGNDPERDYPGRGNRGIRASEELEGHPRTAKVYDIRNAGRHHRFTVSGRLVHNCGYGGGTGAMRVMGGERMGFTEDEMQGIINQWRRANPAICALWRRVENAAVNTVKTGKASKVAVKISDPERARENERRTGAEPGSYSDKFNTGAEIIFRLEEDAATDQKFLTIQLPTRRKLFYAHPFLAPAKNFPDRESLHYYGMNQTTRKWAVTDTWGGKLVENITQAVARDCLADTLLALRRKGMTAVFHVHDEVIVEVEDDSGLDVMLAEMAKTPEWAPGLPLKGAGFVCDYYQKD